MTLNLCNCTGAFVDSEGSPVANTSISVTRVGTVASIGTAPDKKVNVPYVVTVTTDASGVATKGLYPGDYVGVATRPNAPDLKWEIAVPDAASAEWPDIIDSVSAMTPTLLQEATAARDAAAASASAAAAFDGPWFSTHQELLDDTGLTYTTGEAGTLAEGDRVIAGDGMWDVAASDAVDQHITTAGGFKLYEAGPHFSTRTRAAAAWARKVAAGETTAAGTVWTWPDAAIYYDGTTTSITDFSGWAVAPDKWQDWARRVNRSPTRVLASGQSNTVGFTTAAGSFPTFDADNTFWNDSAFVQAAFGTGAPWNGSYMTYVPFVTDMLVDRLSQPCQTVLTGKGSTAITKWTGSTSDRSTHTLNFDAGSGTAYQVDDTLSWGSGATAGTGVITAVTDSGATGSISLKLTSGTGPTDGLTLTGSGGKTCDVNGAPTTTARERFLEIVADYQAAWGSGAVSFFLWWQGESDYDTASEDYLVEFEYLLSELDAWGITDANTTVVIMGHVQQEVAGAANSTIAYNKQGDSGYYMMQRDPRCVWASIYGLAGEDALHIAEASLPLIPDRVEQALNGRIGRPYTDLAQTTKAGQRGHALQIETELAGGVKMFLDNGSGTAFAVGQTLSWTGGAGSIVSAVDAGAKAVLTVTLTSGTAPAIDDTVTSSAGKTATVIYLPAASSVAMGFEDCMGQTIVAETTGGDVSMTLPDLVNSPAWYDPRAWNFTLAITKGENAVQLDPNGRFISVGNDTASSSTRELYGPATYKIEWNGSYWMVTPTSGGEVSWTPEFEFLTRFEDVTLSYTAQYGSAKYDPATGLCTYSFRVAGTLSWTGAIPLGQCQITAPFTCASFNYGALGPYQIAALVGNEIGMGIETDNNTNGLALKMFEPAAAPSNPTANNFTSGSAFDIRGTMVYEYGLKIVDGIENGTFSSDTIWTKGTGWTITGGAAVKAAGTASVISQDLVKVIPSGSVVKAKLYISGFSAGTVQVIFRDSGGTAVGTGTARGVDGIHCEDLTLTGDAASVEISADSTAAMSIDEIKVQRMT